MNYTIFSKCFNIKIAILISILLVLLISCKNKNEIATNEKTNREIADIDTSFNYLPTSSTNQIISHKNYTLSYSEKHEQAEWVAYAITKEQVEQKSDFKRPYFIDDPLVKTGSAKWYNYKNSGYDKGHLCPAGDQKFSQEAFTETFYTSNISPQNHQFNAGIWNNLEQKERYWASKYEKLFIVTGGVLKDNLKTIGEENVSVPNYFYKIIYSKFNNKDKMIAFLIPNKPSKEPFYNYVVTTDKIEQITGIDFFPALEDSIENTLEKQSNYKDWSFR